MRWLALARKATGAKITERHTDACLGNGRVKEGGGGRQGLARSRNDRFSLADHQSPSAVDPERPNLVREAE